MTSERSICSRIRRGFSKKVTAGRGSVVVMARATAYGMFLTILGGQIAFAAPFEPLRLSDSTDGKSHPRLWGDSVIWTDWRSGASGMYRYQFSTGTETRFMSATLGTDFRGDVLSYGAGRPTAYNLETDMYYDLSQQSDTFVYTALGSEWAAWSASSESYQYDVYARRIQADGSPTGEVVQLSDWDGVETHVDTDGEYVVWQTQNESDTNIWLRNMLTGESQQLGAGRYPAMRDDYVAWSDDGLWVHSISTGSNVRISAVGAAERPGIWGDQVVWMNGGCLYGYNLSSGDSFTYDLPSRMGYSTPYSYSPSIYGNTVAWIQMQRPLEGGSFLEDIYAMQIPEPSSLSLIVLGGVAVLFRRR